MTSVSADDGSIDILVDRGDLRHTRIVASAAPKERDLAPGQVLLRVDAFGLTANNITYAVVGDMIPYWGFFPAPEGWGRVPVWGFGDVVASRHDGVAVGARVWGYYPMSTHLVVQPDRVTAQGFVDAAPHRAKLPPFYNVYSFADSGPARDRAAEEGRMVLAGMFMTGFLLDQYLRHDGLFGARQVLIGSASSKTAVGLAFQLHSDRPQGCAITGLTSPGNVGFVRGLGLHDRVVAYDEVATLDPSVPTACVDMSGNGAVLAAVHRHFGANLVHSCLVGATHWEARAEMPADLPGAKPVWFFAPDEGARLAKEWGPDGYQARQTAAWNAFAAKAAGWWRMVRSRGPEAAEGVYRAFLDGTASPEVGHIVSLWD
jgi:hypothetical protein